MKNSLDVIKSPGLLFSTPSTNQRSAVHMLGFATMLAKDFFVWVSQHCIECTLYNNKFVELILFFFNKESSK